MVDFMAECPKLIFDKPRFHYRRETLMRQSLLERLCRAADRLPNGYRFAILEGWRAPLIQKRMYMFAWNRFKTLHPDWSDIQLTRFVNRFSAPMNDRVPPPHTTGGAVDLALVDAQGEHYDVISPYDPRDHHVCAFDAPKLSDKARKHRDILAEALVPEGITNYPSEYWHWSYGDQGWAYRGGHPHALYGPITPEGWEPDPADVQDRPLTLAD